MSFYLFRGLNILTKSIYVKNSTFSKLALIHLWHRWRELCMPYVWLQFMCTSYLVDQLRDVQIATNVHYLDTVCRAVYNMSVCQSQIHVLSISLEPLEGIWNNSNNHEDDDDDDLNLSQEVTHLTSQSSIRASNVITWDCFKVKVTLCGQYVLFPNVKCHRTHDRQP